MVILPNAQAFEAALAARRPQRIRVVFAEGTEDEVEFGNDMISSMAGVTFHSSVNSETNLAIGLCPAAQVSFTIINNNPNVDLSGFEFGEAHIYLGVQLLNDNWQDVSMGYFIVQRPDVVKKRLIEVSAMDRMTLFDVDWPAGITITTSTTLRSLAQAMCNYVGIPLSSASFLNESVTARQVPSDLSNKTMREVLAWIAEAAGSIARINRNGQLEFFWYDQTNTVAQIDENNYTEFSPSWFATPAIDKLVIRNADSTDQYESGTGDTVYIIQDNPFLRQSGTETVQAQTNTRGLRALRDTPATPEAALYNRLSTAPVYHPYGVTTFLDWRYEAGDMLQISSDDTDYTEPIYNLDFTWNGDIVTDMSATGEQTRPPLSPLRRREYSFRGGISGATKLAEDAVQYSTDFTQDDYGIGLLAKAVGVAIETDPTSANYGKPKIDATTGKYVFDANGASLTGQINVTAGGISAVATRADTNATTALGQISVQAGRIDLVVTTTQSGSVINAASIVAEINNNAAGSTQSQVSINADRVKIDSTAGVYLNGVLFRSNGENTLDVNMAKTGKLQVGSSQYSGDMDVYGSVDFYGTSAQVTFQNGFKIGSESPYTTIDANFNPLVAVQVAGPTNDIYTLQYKRLTDSDFQNGSTFSRATSLSGSWSGNTYTITASPQGKTYLATLAKGTVTTAPTIATPVSLTMENPAIQGSATSKSITVSVQYPGISSSNSSVSDVTQIPGSATSSYTVYPYVNVDGTTYYSNGINLGTSLVYGAGWDGAEAKLNIPTTTPATVSSFMTVYYPDKTKTSKQSSTTYTLSDDSTNHKVKLITNGNVIAEQAYTGGASVSSVGLYFDASANQPVITPFTVDSNYTVYPIAILSDNTLEVGNSIRLLASSSSHAVGATLLNSLPSGATVYNSLGSIDPGVTKYVDVYCGDDEKYYSITATGSGGSHSVSLSGITQSDTDPGSSYEQIWQNQIGPGKWYYFTASCGSSTIKRKFFVRYS